jgi:hypothetical protein
MHEAQRGTKLIGIHSIALPAIVVAMWIVYPQWDKGRVTLQITRSGNNPKFTMHGGEPNSQV